MVWSKDFNDYIETLGYARYPDDIRLPKTQILSVFATLEDMNHDVIRSKDNWFNLEVFQRPDKNVESVPLEKLVPASFLADNLNGKYSGKMIYLSMGSMGSMDLDLMRRLVEVLGKTNHKYIVSKGHLHQQYDLAGMVWLQLFHWAKHRCTIYETAQK